MQEGHDIITALSKHMTPSWCISSANGPNLHASLSYPLFALFVLPFPERCPLSKEHGLVWLLSEWSEEKRVLVLKKRNKTVAPPSLGWGCLWVATRRGRTPTCREQQDTTQHQQATHHGTPAFESGSFHSHSFLSFFHRFPFISERLIGKYSTIYSTSL